MYCAMRAFNVTQKGRTIGLAAICSIACVLAAIAPQRASAEAPTTRIIHGTVVANVASNWPYIVALVDVTNFQFCGGTLIDASWVVTAAHCEDVPAIIIGRKKLSSAGGERILVDQQIVHPGWDEDTMQNDVQLLHLAHPVASPTPIGLIDAASDPAVGSTVSVAGWGVTEFSGGNTVDDLRTAQVEVFSNTACNNAYGGGITSGMLCASHFDAVDNSGSSDRDTCQGDSGGPLVAPTAAGPRLAGITSFGVDCASRPFPGVYTRVSTYRDWILGQIGGKANFTVPVVNFGTHEIDDSTTTSTIIVKSVGTLPVTVGGSAVEGTSEFGVTADTCTGAGPLSPNATCTITVSYTPAAVGPAAAILSLSTDSTNASSETLALRGVGTLPVIPPVLTHATLLVAQSGKAVKLPHGRIRVLVKGYFPIPKGALGSAVCFNTSTLTGTVSGNKKKIAMRSMLGWFGERCAASFSMRLPAKARRKKLTVDFHIDGNAVMAPGDKHAEVKIK
jgi:secreted trypsin-like serine protease